MGHSQAEKAITHAKIVAIASQRFRQKGLEGISLADIMSEAGLTVGGFYKHFPTRDALVVDALQHAFSELDAWEEVAKGDLKAAIRSYLSSAHRDDVIRGCALSSLANDVSRAHPDAKVAFERRLRHILTMLEALIASDSKKSRRRKAIVLFSACVGALSLSRGVSDDKFSRELLDATVDELLDLYVPV
ncbi:TetR/AcrR family transcriptional regulator [Caballeronia sp. AZ10_KS36]|uniref:TetR/AcrR family transcriptional regulator n=1 Tax=Caballeronia sp. AZ10_KS36 TaxID=2921757 RepID=UPI0020298F6A|nr:TetR/AcrR family transcriptional regulator [Caballeronia sp. AZ10_KS36]